MVDIDNRVETEVSRRVANRKETMEEELARKVEQEVAKLMIDSNTKLKISERTSAVDPKKKFKCSECEWWGKTIGAVRTHITKTHS